MSSKKNYQARRSQFQPVGRDRHIVVRGVQRDKPDLRKLSRVVIELAPQFAPSHVANILALVREQYFDGLAIMRVQDNYVVQWGDADGKRPLRTAKKTLAPEFDRSAPVSSRA